MRPLYAFYVCQKIFALTLYNCIRLAILPEGLQLRVPPNCSVFNTMCTVASDLTNDFGVWISAEVNRTTIG